MFLSYLVKVHAFIVSNENIHVLPWARVLCVNNIGYLCLYYVSYFRLKDEKHVFFWHQKRWKNLVSKQDLPSKYLSYFANIIKL